MQLQIEPCVQQSVDEARILEPQGWNSPLDIAVYAYFE